MSKTAGSFLLDTHAFLWAMLGGSKLSNRVRAIFKDEQSTLLLSVASIWEIALKSDKGKLEASPRGVDEAIRGFRIRELPIRTVHIRRAFQLPSFEGHKDPFDRLIAAQAATEKIPLVTNDSWLRANHEGFQIVW